MTIIALLRDCMRAVSNYLTGPPFQGRHYVVESMPILHVKSKTCLNVCVFGLNFLNDLAKSAEAYLAPSPGLQPPYCNLKKS